MYQRRKRKQCPFCLGKASKVEDHYECLNCEIVLNFSAMNPKTFNTIYMKNKK